MRAASAEYARMSGTHGQRQAFKPYRVSHGLP